MRLTGTKQVYLEYLGFYGGKMGDVGIEEIGEEQLQI